MTLTESRAKSLLRRLAHESGKQILIDNRDNVRTIKRIADPWVLESQVVAMAKHELAAFEVL